MPSVSRIIASRVPLVELKEGLITREWYRFFFNIYTTITNYGTIVSQNEGATGSFTTVDGKTVTVVKGIITEIV
jgi:hemoglobin-like flavoprotein